MAGRTALLTRVHDVANELNIEKTLVDRVVKAYLNFCKNELRCGHRVNFFDIAQVVPDVEYVDYNTTFAYKCSVVAEAYAVPYNTVVTIVRGYLDTVRDDIFSGRPANIYGIMTLTPLRENGVVTRVHSSISQSLQQDLLNFGNHARVYTNKRFKRRVKEARIYDREDA